MKKKVINLQLKMKHRVLSGRELQEIVDYMDSDSNEEDEESDDSSYSGKLR